MMPFFQLRTMLIISSTGRCVTPGGQEALRFEVVKNEVFCSVDGE
ncbi:hypothetical protein PMI16_02589 [Herbaspirillum sp. CF444]|nr:hypothetical protein PMI16_02589 [Herbaspirillum sp. CF444]